VIERFVRKRQRQRVCFDQRRVDTSALEVFGGERELPRLAVDPDET
jgi:hypothetical protein